jgi:hypothetical protein
MSLLGTGWEVICPDGRVRHWPYLSRTDAEADGRIFTAGGCRAHRKAAALEATQPPCPGGAHTVCPTSFLARAASRGAA